ncbi:MAG: hypothetical protein D6679_03085 [Candidatus Hydrogenedentota bacterium]|nr:MAG: hypothetical protein D6679_03085 [Candidatus Hydrogenedentota bacterium]
MRADLEEFYSELVAWWRRRSSGERMALAFSGGRDSLLLGASAVEAKCAPELLFLRTRARVRDEKTSWKAAEALGLSLRQVVVTEERLLEIVRGYGNLLRKQEDYTGRILAVCEVALAEAASGRALVTGHGPEAVFGGFRRRPVPRNDEERLEILEKNVRRLESVSVATGVPILRPFHEEKFQKYFLRLREEGRDRIEALPNWLAVPPQPSLKSSLQNGSGLHYLFRKWAKRNGFRYVRDGMEALLQEGETGVACAVVEAARRRAG